MNILSQQPKPPYIFMAVHRQYYKSSHVATELTACMILLLQPRFLRWLLLVSADDSHP